MILVKPLCKDISEDIIVQILHKEVGVTIYAECGQMYECGVSAVTVDAIDELATHLQPHAPVLVAEVLARRFGDIVAEIHYDGDLREPTELLHRHGNALRSARQPVYLRRHFAFGKDVNARLIGSDGLHVAILHGCHPTGKAACGMGDKHRGADTVSQCVDGGGVLRMVAEVGRHLAEELTKIGRVGLKLHTFIIFGPNADAPDVEPKHLVGQGLHLRGGGSAAGATATGQVHHVGGIAVAQHKRGEALASIGRHFPTNARTAIAVNEDQRQAFYFSRDLEVDESVIYACTLPGLHLRGPAHELGIVILALALQCLSTNRETALTSNRNRLLRHRSDGKEECGKQHNVFLFHCHLVLICQYSFVLRANSGVLAA